MLGNLSGAACSGPMIFFKGVPLFGGVALAFFSADLLLPELDLAIRTG